MSRNKHRPKVYRDVPDVELYKPNLIEFYKFMYERHMIWYRRFVQKLPPPWTDNPILRDYKFTNVYRELDRGTIWYKENVVPRAKSLKELIWFTVMYRLLNRVETFQIVGMPLPASWSGSRKGWQQRLEKLSKNTIVFTNAHLTLPSKEGQSKISKYIQVLNELHEKLGWLTSEVYGAKGLEDLFYILQDITCVGNFISYEICCDLILAKAVPFSENDWVNPGPGCKVGTRLIYPRTRKVEDFQAKMRELKDAQHIWFEKLGLDFPYLYPITPLSLRSIEHSLCEFQKYMKMKTGIGKQRMYFKPVTGIDSGQIPFRFPR